MRIVGYLLLIAAGLAWAGVLLAHRNTQRADPIREAERLLDRCQNMLNVIEGAVRGLEDTGPATS